MAVLSTTDDFLALVRKSGLVDEQRLDAHLEGLRVVGALPSGAADLAAILVRDGLLTDFQVKQLLAGKWRRFIIGGKYKLLELIGAGGMGQVFLCEHIRMRRLVALKILPLDKASDPAAVERFFREARAVAALDHANIVRAHDIDQDDQLHFLVMEFVDGICLHDIVKRNGPMDFTRAAHYIAQAACGLQCAHEAGWVHRDIKPGNLLLDRQGVVKILDLGLARFFFDNQTAITDKYDQNSVLGTADYLSPEQVENSHTVDIRSDIYSLGATFYYLLTGRAPFEDGTVTQKMHWHKTTEPEALAQHRKGVPDAMSVVIKRMMAKTPGQRYQVPGDVVTALAEWVQTPIPPPSAAEMPQPSPAVWTILQSGSGPIRRGPLVLPPLVPVRAGPRTPPPGAVRKPNLAAEARTEAIASGSSVTRAAPRPPEPVAAMLAKRHWLWLAIAAVVGLLVMIVAAVIWLAFFKGSGPATGSTAAATTSEGSARSVPPLRINPVAAITPVEARNHRNDEVTVKMKVKRTGRSETLMFLNSELKRDDEDNFVIVISSGAQELYKKKGISDLKEYFENKTILVSGKVMLFQEQTWQIRVEDPEQIRLVEDKQPSP